MKNMMEVNRCGNLECFLSFFNGLFGTKVFFGKMEDYRR